MGDLTSSLFALGYHESVGGNSHSLPRFVIELRKAAVSRIHSADKKLAVFLGRPPRILKAFCNIQLPTNVPGLWNAMHITGNARGSRSDTGGAFVDGTQPDQEHTEVINCTADTRCSAIFASIKEDILVLFRDDHSQDKRESARSVIPDLADMANYNKW